jgi:hypothetical protein
MMNSVVNVLLKSLLTIKPRKNKPKEIIPLNPAVVDDFHLEIPRAEPPPAEPPPEAASVRSDIVKRLNPFFSAQFYHQFLLKN